MGEFGPWCGRIGASAITGITVMRAHKRKIARCTQYYYCFTWLWIVAHLCACRYGGLSVAWNYTSVPSTFDMTSFSRRMNPFKAESDVFAVGMESLFFGHDMVKQNQDYCRLTGLHWKRSVVVPLSSRHLPTMPIYCSVSCTSEWF